MDARGSRTDRGLNRTFMELKPEEATEAASAVKS